MNSEKTEVQASPKESQDPSSPPKKTTSTVKKILLLLLVLLLLLGSAGSVWFWQQQKINDQKAEIAELKDAPQNPQPDSGSSQPQISNKEYATQYEKLKLTYPGDLQLVDTSISNEDGYTTGSDIIKITAGDYTLAIQTGLYGVGGSCPECTVLYSEPIEVLGQQLYLNYVSDGGVNISYILLAKDPDNYIYFLTGKNIKTADGDDTLISIGITLEQPQPLATVKNSQGIQTLKEVIASLKY